MSAKEFSLQLDRSISDMDEDINTVVQSIGMYCLRGVVMKSPVDTGRFRGNWIVTRTGPSAKTTQKTDKTGGPTIQKGVSNIEKYDYDKNNVLIIQNNLPYANRLENGYSSKAPNGMVALTVNEAAQRYSDVIVRWGSK